MKIYLINLLSILLIISCSEKSNDLEYINDYFAKEGITFENQLENASIYFVTDRGCSLCYQNLEKVFKEKS